MHTNNDSIAALIAKVQQFCEDRDWDQFHTAKDLAIGISTEAGELLDLFRFKSNEQVEHILNGPERERVEEELADVLFFVLRFAQMFDMPLDRILDEKIRKNGIKYPVDKSRGSNLKYSEREGGEQ